MLASLFSALQIRWCGWLAALVFFRRWWDGAMYWSFLVSLEKCSRFQCPIACKYPCYWMPTPPEQQYNHQHHHKTHSKVTVGFQKVEVVSMTLLFLHSIQIFRLISWWNWSLSFMFVFLDRSLFMLRHVFVGTREVEVEVVPPPPETPASHARAPLLGPGPRVGARVPALWCK